MTDTKNLPTIATSAFDKIDNPIKAAMDFGKTIADAGMFGVKNPAQGAVLMLTCICERKNPFEIMRKYHLMTDGKLAPRAEALLATFNQRGGEHEWINDGTKLVEAVLKLIKKGREQTISYTMEEAKTARLIKSDSAWVKSPAAMLRAACTRKAIKMVDPSIYTGDVDADETFETEPVPVPEHLDTPPVKEVNPEAKTEEKPKAKTPAPKEKKSEPEKKKEEDRFYSIKVEVANMISEITNKDTLKSIDFLREITKENGKEFGSVRELPNDYLLIIQEKVKAELESVRTSRKAMANA